jgi:hypothetical protein
MAWPPEGPLKRKNVLISGISKHALSVSLDHESVKNRIGDSQLTIECLDCYKPLEIERTTLTSYKRR